MREQRFNVDKEVFELSARILKVETFSNEISTLHSKTSIITNKLNATIDQLRRDNMALKSEVHDVCGRISVKMLEATELFNTLSNKLLQTKMQQESMNANLLNME